MQIWNRNYRFLIEFSILKSRNWKKFASINKKKIEKITYKFSIFPKKSISDMKKSRFMQYLNRNYYSLPKSAKLALENKKKFIKKKIMKKKSKKKFSKWPKNFSIIMKKSI